MSSSLFDSLSRGLSALLAPIVRIVEVPGLLPRVLAELGVPPDASNNALLQSLSAIAGLKDRIEALGAQETPSFKSIAAVLAAAADAFEALRKLEQQGPLADLEGLGRELVDLLLMAFLESRVPAARPAAALLTLLEPADEQEGNAPVVKDGRLVRDIYCMDRWHLDRLPALVKDPLAVLRAEYGNAMQTLADANAMADKLFPRLQRLLRSLGVSCRYGFAPRDAAFLGDAAPLMGHALIVYVDDPLYGEAAESGVVLSLSAAQQGDLGLVISPFGTIAVQGSAGPWKLAADLTAGVDVVAWGRHGMTLLASPGTVDVTGSLSATLASSSDQPAYVLGDPAGSRIEVGGAEIKVATSLSEAEQTLAISGDVSKSAIVIAPGGGDGFINSILPAEGLRAEFDLGLAWSNTRGLTLRGSAGLETTLPIGLTIGGVTLSTVYLGLQARDASALAEISASVGVSIGPIHAVIDRVGLSGALAFPPAGGNIGVADLSVGFKPPSGVGLTIDAAGVTGGGFLRFDPQRGLYAGEMHLNLEGTIAVRALGLIATRLPDDSKGFSLLVIITAEDFKPIPLGLGFKLTGIGGLLAINRTFNEEVLREGIKNHTLDSVLFPANPARDALQLLSNLDKAFPVAKGHHLFGPMVEIEWGTPTLLTMQLGIVLEIGARLRLLVMGQVEAILPRRDHDLLRIKMDAVGILDFDQGTASLDAVLYESRLLKKFVLTGGMAMRLKWKGSPSFALAVGGLHHAFNPPANFPRLDRLAINLSAGDNPRILCEAYFAITSNTVQFGARANLYASAHGFSIEGDIGFDVLIQLNPFHFLAEFHASIQLKRGSRNLFKVKVEGALEGPRPLSVKGKATFEIFWWDISIKFDKTLVEGERPPPPPAINVLNELAQALADRRNWEGALPTGARRVVTVRQTKTTDDVTIHPLGKLGVKQTVVPLNLTRDIDKFGSATPSGPRRFTISSVTVGELTQTKPPPLTDFFAPAQFFEMSDDESIASPSFDEMEAGFMVGVDDFAFNKDDGAGPVADGDVVLGVLLEYETILVDTESITPEPRKGGYRIDLERLWSQARFGAAGRSVLRRTGTAKYQNPVHTAKVTLARPGFAIASTGDLSAQPVDGAESGKSMNWIDAQEALRQLHRQDPAKAKRRQVVHAYELVRS